MHYWILATNRAGFLNNASWMSYADIYVQTVQQPMTEPSNPPFCKQSTNAPVRRPSARGREKYFCHAPWKPANCGVSALLIYMVRYLQKSYISTGQHLMRM